MNGTFLPAVSYKVNIVNIVMAFTASGHYQQEAVSGHDNVGDMREWCEISLDSEGGIISPNSGLWYLFTLYLSHCFRST